MTKTEKQPSRSEFLSTMLHDFEKMSNPVVQSAGGHGLESFPRKRVSVSPPEGASNLQS
jgi:hypothetical protein